MELGMRVLAFDQSLTATAAVLLNAHENCLSIEEQRITRPKSAGIYRMMELRAWMDSIIRRTHPEMVVRELHHMRQFGAAGALQSLTAVLDMLAYEGNFLSLSNYAMVAPGTWKKYCLGKGNLKKDTAYLMTLNGFFQRTPLLVEKDDLQVTDDNIADAICMGITGYFGRQAKFGRQIPGDKATINALTKASEKMFDYGSQGKPL